MIKRGDTVDYTFPVLVNFSDVDQKTRGKAGLLTLPAIVRAVNADATVDLYVCSELSESPRIVRSVKVDTDSTMTAAAPNRNQCDDRTTAIMSGDLDAKRDTVKGWAKERV